MLNTFNILSVFVGFGRGQIVGPYAYFASNFNEAEFMQ
jgi:hypothetical protein